MRNPRILIFLLGSLGDTVVALPALHLVARQFPTAERRILSHSGISEKAAPMPSLLNETGLVHGYFQFPVGAGMAKHLLKLALEIREWKPDVLIHLHQPRGLLSALRDLLYFKICGVKKQYGLPLKRDLREIRRDCLGMFEQRSEYLNRKLASLGDCQLTCRSSWDLAITKREADAAVNALSPLNSCKGVLTFSIGAKVDTKDWEDPNWRALIQIINSELPGWGLAGIGAAVERMRTDSLLSWWNGASVNLCGHLSVRESAAVLGKSKLFLGHDSGPMHLAAAVGTPTVAIFSARDLLGHWFPYGNDHITLFERVPCAGCGLEECLEFGKRCILPIQPREVANAVLKQLFSGDYYVDPRFRTSDRLRI